MMSTCMHIFVAYITTRQLVGATEYQNKRPTSLKYISNTIDSKALVPGTCI